MIRTHIFPCSLDKARADTLNRESGRIYTAVKVEHYRIYRQTGHWLSQYDAMRLNDYLSGTLLHAHSRDAAQEAFYKACKTARTNRGVVAGSRYPHRNKGYRTTIWKNTGIRKQEGMLILALARGSNPVSVSLPSNLAPLPPKAFLEMRLVWERAARHYFWHAVVEDGQAPAPAPGTGTAGVDLGEIHPAAATDGKEAVVFSCRELRSLSQYANKRLASIQQALSRKERNSRRYRRLVARKTRFLAKQKQCKRDMEHKISRQVVDWAVERGIGVLAVGDVRDAADGVKKGKVCNQKIANWTHGKVRQYIQYKAEAAGMEVELVKEHYTSQTCPACGHRHKPKGRDYICPACGFCGHRDIVGAVNILSRQTCGDVGKISPPADTKYRYPFQRVMRSRPDTADLARHKREATPL